MPKESLSNNYKSVKCMYILTYANYMRLNTCVCVLMYACKYNFPSMLQKQSKLYSDQKYTIL